MKQNIKNNKTNKKIKIIIHLNIIIKNQNHNNIPYNNQIIKNHTIQNILILKPKT